MQRKNVHPAFFPRQESTCKNAGKTQMRYNPVMVTNSSCAFCVYLYLFGQIFLFLSYQLLTTREFFILSIVVLLGKQFFTISSNKPINSKRCDQ